MGDLTQQIDNVARMAPDNERKTERVCDVRQVSKVYFSRAGDVVVALQHISLTISAGEVLAVIGPSGCGKSSLLRILAGLDREFEGDVTWGGNAMSAQESPHRPASAVVFQSDSLLPWLTVEKNVELPLKPLGLDKETRKERVKKQLTVTGLWGFRGSYPHELSGGMRQRAAMARALAMDPFVLLLDEPLAALDAQTRIIMQQELLDLFSSTKPAVLYVTHDIEEAVTLSDRVIVMSARPGRITHVEDVDVERHSDVMATRNTSGFRNTAEKLWAILAQEVGETLSGLTR